MTDKTRTRKKTSKRNPDRGGSGAHRNAFDQAGFEDSRAGRAEAKKRAARRANPKKRKKRKPMQKGSGKKKK